MLIMSDEEVIRRRLLIDGDGTGEDRKLNIFLKKLIKWAMSPNLNPADKQQAYDSLLSQLSQCEFAVRRSIFQERSNKKQKTKYKGYHTKLGDHIGLVKNSIEDAKVNLSCARVWKQNRLMYDLLAESIELQPDRKTTDKKLEDLNKTLSELEEENKLQMQKMNLRKKQFHVLISSANQLRSMIEESKNDDLMSSSLDDITNSPTGPEAMSD